MLMREIDILEKTKGDHLINLITTANTPNNFYIIMECCNGGSLENILEKRGKISEKEAISILKQLVDGFLEM